MQIAFSRLMRFNMSLHEYIRNSMDVSPCTVDRAVILHQYYRLVLNSRASIIHGYFSYRVARSNRRNEDTVRSGNGPVGIGKQKNAVVAGAQDAV